MEHAQMDVRESAESAGQLCPDAARRSTGIRQDATALVGIILAHPAEVHPHLPVEQELDDGATEREDITRGGQPVGAGRRCVQQQRRRPRPMLLPGLPRRPHEALRGNVPTPLTVRVEKKRVERWAVSGEVRGLVEREISQSDSKPRRDQEVLELDVAVGQPSLVRVCHRS